jgi:bifunctional UDP-N-acetylglucosamine pyrophosphorylase/glucosamine-1-phosphate N-acetyltransferase
MRPTRFRRNAEKPFYVAILAAGKSKRMNSKKSKVLHKLCGKPLLFYPLRIAMGLNPEKIFVIVGGSNSEEVRSTFSEYPVEFVEQPEPLGTGDAVMRMEEFFKDKEADLMVIPGDAPLLMEETALDLLSFHKERGAIATVLTAEHPNPTGYGRIVRSVGDRILMIVEEADAFPEEKEIKEINAGVYVFDTPSLYEWLPDVRADNRQGEYYLTDVIEILQRRVGSVYAHKIEDWHQVIGVNTRQDLALAERILEERLKSYWMNNGVTFVKPDSVYLEFEVEIGKDTVIYPFVSLMGKTKIGEECEIGPNLVLKDVEIPSGTVLKGECHGF